MTIQDQYKVEGQPNSVEGVEFPYYTFVWHDYIARDHGFADAREAALDFQRRMEGKWESGPFVTARTVWTTDWRPLDEFDNSLGAMTSADLFDLIRRAKLHDFRHNHVSILQGVRDVEFCPRCALDSIVEAGTHV